METSGENKMTDENPSSVGGFEIKPPPPARNGSRVGMPLMSEFVRFLDANEGVWAVFHTYQAKQSGYQRASDAQKKYGDKYEFVARHTEDGTTVYGRKKLTF
jgi:hypothetical protein